MDEAVLEGHLGIAKELLSFMSPEKKYELGSDASKGIFLIRVFVSRLPALHKKYSSFLSVRKITFHFVHLDYFQELVEDFVFPSSRLMLLLQKTGQLSQDQAVPVCTSPGTLTMAFDFLVALCVGCMPNMRLLVEMLSEMFYSGN